MVVAQRVWINSSILLMMNDVSKFVQGLRKSGISQDRFWDKTVFRFFLDSALHFLWDFMRIVWYFRFYDRDDLANSNLKKNVMSVGSHRRGIIPSISTLCIISNENFRKWAVHFSWQRMVTVIHYPWKSEIYLCYTKDAVFNILQTGHFFLNNIPHLRINACVQRNSIFCTSTGNLVISCF